MPRVPTIEQKLSTPEVGSSRLSTQLSGHGLFAENRRLGPDSETSAIGDRSGSVGVSDDASGDAEASNGEQNLITLLCPGAPQAASRDGRIQTCHPTPEQHSNGPDNLGTGGESAQPSSLEGNTPSNDYFSPGQGPVEASEGKSSEWAKMDTAATSASKQAPTERDSNIFYTSWEVTKDEPVLIRGSKRSAVNESVVSDRPIVTLHGPGWRCYIDQETLCGYSKYYAAALSGRWAETRLSLRPVYGSFEVIQRFLSWTVTGSLGKMDFRAHARLAVDLYIFADYCDIPLLRRNILDGFSATFDGTGERCKAQGHDEVHPQCRPHQDIFDYVWDNLPREAPLRRWFFMLLIFHGSVSETWVPDGVHIEGEWYLRSGGECAAMRTVKPEHLEAMARIIGPSMRKKRLPLLEKSELAKKPLTQPNPQSSDDVTGAFQQIPPGATANVSGAAAGHTQSTGWFAFGNTHCVFQ
ncbi:hypothetical protein H2203_003862 [Taxawa tesnikishii (nom. ined.)]|nr:hypothetical protein H2203_003862 [Dothideales sp. JES 119]